MAALKLARRRAKEAENRLALFDASSYAMAANQEDAKALKGPYINEANQARERLINLLEEDNPEFAEERRAAERAKWAANRRALRSAFGD